MTTSFLLLMAMAGAISPADDTTMQCEKSRVTVLLWLIDSNDKVDHKDPQPGPDDNQGDETHKHCEKCHGTKFVKSGDGLQDIPCPCGKYCKCQAPAPNPDPTPDPTPPSPGPSPGPAPDNGCCGKHCRCQQPCRCGPNCRCDHCPVGRHNNRRHPNQMVMTAIPQSVVAATCLAADDPKAVTADPAIPVRQLYVIGARWCKPCQPVKATAKALRAAGWDESETDGDALIAVLDFDAEVVGKLRGLQIDTLPTILLMENGKEIQRLVGADAHIDAFQMANLLLGPAQKDCQYKTPRGKIMIQKYVEPPKQKPTVPAISSVPVPRGTGSALTLNDRPVTLVP